MSIGIVIKMQTAIRIAARASVRSGSFRYFYQHSAVKSRYGIPMKQGNAKNHLHALDAPRFFCRHCCEKLESHQENLHHEASFTAMV